MTTPLGFEQRPPTRSLATAAVGRPGERLNHVRDYVWATPGIPRFSAVVQLYKMMLSKHIICYRSDTTAREKKLYPCSVRIRLT